MAGIRSFPSRIAKSYGLAIVLGVAGALVCGAGVWVGIGLIDAPQPHFWTDIARAALTLGSGLILGGAVKATLDHYQQSQEKREQDRESRRQLIGELRNIRQRTEGARLMIKAHKSAEAYAEQMSVLIDCHLALLKIKHTMELLRGDTPDTDPREAYLQGMADYLGTLQEEYANNYADLDDRQRYDRAVVQQYLSELAAANADFDARELPVNHTWQFMRDSCPRLKDLVDSGDDYIKKFRLPLHLLIKHLWSARRANSNALFDDRVVHDFESNLKKALSSVGATPDQDDGNGQAQDETDDDGESRPS